VNQELWSKERLGIEFRNKIDDLTLDHLNLRNSDQMTFDANMLYRVGKVSLKATTL
jgi:hypothetical protein